jgi:hypothetical protein
MKTKTAAIDSSLKNVRRGLDSSISLDEQIAEFLARKPEHLPLPAALKEIQASFAIEGMEISDERLAASAERYMSKVKSGEADALIAAVKAKFA